MEWVNKQDGTSVDAVEIESEFNLRKVHNFLKDKDTSGWYFFEEVYFKRIEKGYFATYNSEPTKLDAELSFENFVKFLRSRKDEMTFDY